MNINQIVFASVPRLYNRIYDKVLAGVKSKGGLAALLFAKALSSKKEGLKNGDLTHWLWDKLVFAKIREKLGGRVRMMITGAAPIAAEVVEFLRCAFSVNIIEGYGQTESAAALTITGWKDYSVGHIGAPMTCFSIPFRLINILYLLGCEIKLVDVESMGYTSKSTPPKGEICFRGTNVFKEYYKLPEKTSETIDKDGYVHTGDIGSWDEQGRLKIIDRIKK